MKKLLQLALAGVALVWAGTAAARRASLLPARPRVIG